MNQRKRAKARREKRDLPSGTGVFAPKGFTLIEVMVTFTVLGFILLIIFGVFRLGLSAWEKGESIKEEYQKVRIISQLISRQIKSIVPYKIKTQKAEGDYLAFEGKAHSLKFVSALPLKARQPEGLVYAVYEFKEGGRERGRFILYEERALNRDFMEENPKEELGVSLLEEISEVRFEYYQEEDPEKEQAGGWVTEWNAKEKLELPKAVRMTLILKDGKGEKEESPIILLASLPSNRFEEVRIGPRRGVIPQRPPR
jgi:prepilin-type N-terminal cleavage/methylation domain-containing protein